MTVEGQPVLQVVLGGIGVLGPAAKLSVLGKARRPQHGWNAGEYGIVGTKVVQSKTEVLMRPRRLCRK